MGDRFRPRSRRRLAHYAGDVIVDRVAGDPEYDGDLIARLAFGNPEQTFELALGQFAFPIVTHIGFDLMTGDIAGKHRDVAQRLLGEDHVLGEEQHQGEPRAPHAEVTAQ